MIKNKTLNIKIIFKTYLKIFKKKVKNISGSQTDFCFAKHQRTIFKIWFSRLFSKTVPKQGLASLTKHQLVFR